MNALVLSGGGSKGAWGGGVAAALSETTGRDWDLHIGCSTGSLLSLKTASNSFGLLKDMYTNITADDVYDRNPYDSNGSLKLWNVVSKILRRRQSLAEITPLKRLVKRYFTVDDFQNLRTSKKEILLAVTNIKTGRVEYVSSDEVTYDMFLRGVAASCSVPPIMPPVTMGNAEYLDGGIMEHAPIAKAIEMGATHVDAIVHHPMEYPIEDWKSSRMFSIIERTVELLQREVATSDIEIAKLLRTINSDVTLNMYFTPRVLTDNSLDFTKSQMREWWQEGRDQILHGKLTAVTIKSKRNDSGQPTISVT